MDAKLGGASGKLWWFADKAFAARLEAVPLTERVEATVFRCLHEKGRVTFTEVWDSALTPGRIRALPVAAAIFGCRIARLRSAL
jgi:hypothetical protein